MILLLAGCDFVISSRLAVATMQHQVQKQQFLKNNKVTKSVILESNLASLRMDNINRIELTLM